VRLLARNTNWKLLTAVTIISGVVYNSWPLGYVLNPPVAHALASDLEGVHQPYNWVFIGGDISSSILLILVSVFLLWRYGKGRGWLKLVALYSILFSIGTILDAALPLRCVSSANQCPNFTHSPLLFIHGIFSILASVFLFLAIFHLWRQLRDSWILKIALGGYTLFGLISLYNVLVTSKSAASQHFYITLCSLCIAIIPLTIRDILARQDYQIENTL
jgi:hypothetical protein